VSGGTERTEKEQRIYELRLLCGGRKTYVSRNMSDVVGATHISLSLFPSLLLSFPPSHRHLSLP